MNRFVLAGVLGIVTLGVVAAGDEIVEGRRGLTSDTSPTTKHVTITGVQNGQVLTYNSGGVESLMSLIVFTRITIDGMPDFNKAEELLSTGKFADAVVAYDNITGLDGWKKELVAARKNFASLMKFQFATALKYKGDDVLAKIAEAKKRAVSQPTAAMLAATSQPVGVGDIPSSLLSAVVKYQFSPTEPNWTLRPFLSEQQCKQITEKQAPMFEKLNEVMKGLVVAVSVADMKNVMFEKIDDSQCKIALIADGDEDLSSTVIKGIVSTEMMKAIKSRNRLDVLLVIDSLESDSARIPLGYCLNAKAIYLLPYRQDNASVLTDGPTPVREPHSPVPSSSSPNTVSESLKTSLYGSGGRADRVVYVIDRRTDMSETFDALKAEIIRSISSLRDKQSFQIIFLGDKPQTLFEDGLSAATRDNKIKAVEFIKDIKLDGKDAKAAAAMTTAFESLKTLEGEKMIHLLSAGLLADIDAVTELNKKENSGQKKVVINTFQYSALSDKVAEESLTDLAKETGGKYKFVEAE